VGDVPIGPSKRKLAAAALMLPVAAWRLLRGRHDVVLASEESAVLAAALKPLFAFRLVYDMDDVLSRRVKESGWLSSRLLLALVRAAERFALRRADAVVTNSAETTLFARAAVGAARVHFYHHAPEAAPPSAARDAEASGRFVYAGNLEPYQGVALLLDALAVLRRERPEARLDVIGGRPEQAARLKEKARRLGVAEAVRWLGPRPLPETLARLRGARALVSPMTERKAVPMKLYAYMDSGAPIVATDLPNHTQLLDADCAVLTAPEPRALAAGLRRVLDDPALGGRLAAEAARRRAALTPAADCRRALAAACGLALPPAP
jgi:glycosyltransferase involved in cell wall biosynthesis